MATKTVRTVGISDARISRSPSTPDFVVNSERRGAGYGQTDRVASYNDIDHISG